MDEIVIKGKVKWVNIDVAENGFMVNWEEQSKRPGGGEYDHMSCTPRRHVFTEEMEDEAFDLFVKLKKMEMGISGTTVIVEKEEAGD